MSMLFAAMQLSLNAVFQALSLNLCKLLVGKTIKGTLSSLIVITVLVQIRKNICLFYSIRRTWCQQIFFSVPVKNLTLTEEIPGYSQSVKYGITIIVNTVILCIMSDNELQKQNLLRLYYVPLYDLSVLL